MRQHPPFTVALVAAGLPHITLKKTQWKGDLLSMARMNTLGQILSYSYATTLSSQSKPR